MSTEKQFYFCRAFQPTGVDELGDVPWVISMTASILLRFLKICNGCRKTCDPFGADMVPIMLTLDQRTRTQFKCLYERGFEVPVSDAKLPSKREYYKEIIAGYLTSLRVPEDQHAALVEKIYQVIQLAVPAFPIRVIIVKVARNAVTSYIQGLEKVTADSFEEANISCPICWDDFEHIVNDEQMIVSLPCVHYYHVDCIVPWLQRSQVCPLCQYSMTNSSSKPSRPRMTWPKLLVMSAGGIVTATLVCRLLKRT